MKKDHISYSISDNDFVYNHIRREQFASVEIHMHDWYEIFYFLSGDVTYYVEGQSYKIKPHDILITNNRELHRPIFESNQPYERAIFQFTPAYISSFQYPDYDLLHCLEKRKLGYFNLIESEKVLAYGIHNDFKQIDSYIESSAPESLIMIKITFVKILVLLNKIFMEKKKSISEDFEYDRKILSILDYINRNLDKKITLDLLEQKFYINKYYLCHLFKKNTGFTVIEYLTYKRIMKAKELLMTGMPVLETCSTVGFNDYSNFYKVFKKLVGMSPKNFAEK